jgi:hypothetical protein
MQPSSGGCFPSIQFFSTEAAAFVMPILFSDFLISDFLKHVVEEEEENK